MDACHSILLTQKNFEMQIWKFYTTWWLMNTNNRNTKVTQYFLRKNASFDFV